jgi:hypothetical protein
MLAHATQIRNLEELRQFVYFRLCDYDQLEPGAFPMTERVLVRGGVPCGIYYCLHGPRSVKYTSIWETEGNTIRFYGPTGERFHKTQLEESPELDPERSAGWAADPARWGAACG